MATVRDLRKEVEIEFTKVNGLLAAEFLKANGLLTERQVKIKDVADAQASWKVGTDHRMIRQDNQQATLESKVSNLIVRLEKLEKSGGVATLAVGRMSQSALNRKRGLDGL